MADFGQTDFGPIWCFSFWLNKEQDFFFTEKTENQDELKQRRTNKETKTAAGQTMLSVFFGEHVVQWDQLSPLTPFPGASQEGSLGARRVGAVVYFGQFHFGQFYFGQFYFGQVLQL